MAQETEKHFRNKILESLTIQLSKVSILQTTAKAPKAKTYHYLGFKIEFLEAM